MPEAPPPPPAAREIFRDKLPIVVRYAAMLAGPAVERGLLGPREVPRLWSRHILNCAALSELIPRDATVVDIGSGAGLPGIVLAILRPDLDITLLDPLLRRTGFLEWCRVELGLRRVRVRRARAEEVAGELVVDVVTARAVAPLDRLATWALPLLRPGGLLLALKGERAGEEINQARAVLHRLGARNAEMLRVGQGKVEPAATVVRVVAGSQRRPSGVRRRPDGRSGPRGRKR